jgi:hypothetical protein
VRAPPIPSSHVAQRERRRRFLGATPVHEALRIVITDAGDPLGTLFLVHGHQGTIDSGDLLVVPFSRLVVRFVWATLQRLQGFASTSPATDAVLRGKHDRAMAGWADGHPERIVLVAGHTHRPVFPGTLPPDLHEQAAAAEERHREAVSSGDGVAAARAERELARARALRAEPYVPPELERPSYFNTGCCSFGDGDLTGLELCDGEARLVRWLDDAGAALAQQLEPPIDLRAAFGALTGSRPSVA